MSGRAPEDSGEKSHEPTERRLEEARRKGDVPRTPDLAAAAATAGLLVALTQFGPAAVQAAGAAGAALLEAADRVVRHGAQDGGARVNGALAAAAGALAVFVLVPAAAAVAAIALQGPVVAAPDKLWLRLERISPAAGLRNRFGGTALLAFAKNAVKLALIGTGLGLVIAGRLPEIVAAAALDARHGLALLASVGAQVLGVVAAIQLSVGLLDMLLQRRQHRNRLRMTHRELVEEMRESEGDPHLRAARRQRAVDLATRAALGAVPKADVVIVNPTHIAVALRWDRTAPGAPVCVAKGEDALALRIRARAEACGVPVRRDPPAARAIHATVAVGMPIRVEHYRAVAAAIRFADAVRRKARGRGAG